MSPDGNISLQRLGFPSTELDQVIALHRANSKRLGFLPLGAFEEHAKLGRIIIANDEQGVLLGYVLYRVARGRAMIVHLCVSELARRKGVARQLVSYLKGETVSLEGIGLHCRRDYEAGSMWAAYGFEAVNSKTGRGRDGEELTFWWFSHGHGDLFSRAADAAPVRQRVVIDANVFYDLHARDTPESEDSKALLADWVQSSIELVVTKELRNEITRAPDVEQRKSSLAAATHYPTLLTNDSDFQRLCAELRKIFSETQTARDGADLRQIANAIAGGAHFMVTRDRALIERCESLYESHDLLVLHPAELINHLDSIEREGDYRPARIGGSRLTSALLKADNLDQVVETFRRPGERVTDFKRVLHHLLGQPKAINIQVIVDQKGNLVLIGVVDRSAATVLDVPVIRLAMHPLAPTMLRNFFRTCLHSASGEGRSIVTVHDTTVSSLEADVLREFGFSSFEGMWAKLTLRAAGRLEETATAAGLLQLPQNLTHVKAAVLKDMEAARAMASPVAVTTIERLLWPAKVVAPEVPSFIVPIRPEWAQHFFDVELGSQLLFGLRDDLHLGVEGVYYRSAENNNLTVPGRLLWYVSRGTGDGSMCVKACSQLEEVVVGKPKDLFRQFRRLGVFEWRDVFSAANNDASQNIAALRFRMTERFSVPVNLEKLESFGVRGPFMSPRRISEIQFANIYKTGCALI